MFTWSHYWMVNNPTTKSTVQTNQQAVNQTTNKPQTTNKNVNDVQKVHHSVTFISEYNQFYHTYHLLIKVYILLCVTFIRGVSGMWLSNICPNILGSLQNIPGIFQFISMIIFSPETTLQLFLCQLSQGNYLVIKQS